jgi:hypothetical protein
MTHHEHPNVTVAREGFEALQRGDTAWMEQHMADDVVWHVGGNSKWAGSYEGKAKVLEYFGRQAQATETAVEIHDIVGNDEHVVVLGARKPPPGTGPAPSGSTPRSSTSATARRPRSGGWPRTTPPSTRSWTACPTERRQGSTPASHRGVARRGVFRAHGSAGAPAGPWPMRRLSPWLL